MNASAPDQVSGRAELDQRIEQYCLALPGSRLSVQWGDTRVFKVCEKIFVLLAGPSEPWGASFKVTPDSYELLIGAKAARPAPYLAKAKWVRVENLDVMDVPELLARFGQSYRLIAAGLSKTQRTALGML
jgi:predicted DNA-binding protein (MmcQ/YjbR family)